MHTLIKAPLFRRYIFPIAIILIAFCLLVFKLDAKSLSGDEFGNVQIERGNLNWIFASMTSTWSQHPPGSHLLMHAWIKWAGQDDFIVRFPAVCWALLSIPLLYRLSQRWFGYKVALIATFLYAFAPDLILYGRMEKYYSLVVTMVLGSTLIFDQNMRRPRPASLIMQGVITIAILYTDYFAALFIVSTQNLIALLKWRQSPKEFFKWLLPQIAAALLFIPFLRTALLQAFSVHDSSEADLAAGALAMLAKLGYFFFAYSVGETIFPWSPSAIIGAVLSSALTLFGIRAWLSKNNLTPDQPAFWNLAFLIIPIPGVIVLSSTLLKTVPMITLPNHILFTLPFFTMLVAKGITQTGKYHLTIAFLMWLTLLPSLNNYYNDRQFHNQVFVTPSREVLAYLIAQAAPDDLMHVDIASGIQYYYEQQNQTYPKFAETLEEIQTSLDSGKAACVWLITVGRDRTRAKEPQPIPLWLQQNLILEKEKGFAEQDNTYRAIKARLTGRPAYEFRVIAQRFCKPGHGSEIQEQP